jgi:putative transcriptional regulator
MDRWLTGRLLIAMPLLDDPNFSRAVVFILDHDEDGALGVVLNRASDVPVTDAVEKFGDLVSVPTVLFGGGPVEPDALVAIGRRSEGSLLAADRLGPEAGWAELEALDQLAQEADDEDGDPIGEIVDGVQLVDLDEDPLRMSVELSQVRLFAGYAGWAPGQLEEELWHGAWIAVRAEPEDVFTPDPDVLWAEVLARQPGLLRLLADFPEDPALN